MYHRHESMVERGCCGGGRRVMHSPKREAAAYRICCCGGWGLRTPPNEKPQPIACVALGGGVRAGVTHSPKREAAAYGVCCYGWGRELRTPPNEKPQLIPYVAVGGGGYALPQTRSSSLSHMLLWGAGVTHSRKREAAAYRVCAVQPHAPNLLLNSPAPHSQNISTDQLLLSFLITYIFDQELRSFLVLC